MSTSSLPIFFISILHLSIYESILATAWARWVLRAVLSCRRGNHRTFQHSPRIWSLQVGFLFIFFTPALCPLADTIFFYLFYHSDLRSKFSTIQKIGLTKKTCVPNGHISGHMNLMQVLGIFKSLKYGYVCFYLPLIPYL